MHVLIIVIRVVPPPPITSKTFNIRAIGVAHGWRSQTVDTAYQSPKDSEQMEMYLHTTVERSTFVAVQNKLTSIRLRRPTLGKSWITIWESALPVRG